MRKLKRSSNRGFTLIEVMVVAGCMMVVLIPLWQVFRQGTRSSMKGMLQIDTALEAKKVLRQLSSDLKQACWMWSDPENSWKDCGEASFTVEMMIKSGGPNGGTSFLYFPKNPPIEEIAPVPSLDGLLRLPVRKVSMKAFRRPSRVSYSLTKIEEKGLPVNFPIFELIRTEKMNPDVMFDGKQGPTFSKSLSKRVCFLNVKPYTVTAPDGTRRGMCWITLRMIDFLNRNQPGEIKINPGEPLSKGNPFVVADFFDVVCPEFLISHEKLNRTYYRNPFTDPISPKEQRILEGDFSEVED